MVEEYDSMQTDDGRKLKVDECYTTTDRALKYTLLHLENKKRIATIKRLMDFTNKKYGIIEQALFGYESVGSNDEESDLCGLPSVKVLMRDMERGAPAFSAWIKESKSSGILAALIKRRRIPAGAASRVQVVTILKCRIPNIH